MQSMKRWLLLCRNWKSSEIRLRITHQTGEADFERVRERYVDAGWGEQADVQALH